MTYAELKTAIQDYLQNSETSFVAHLPDFIKAAEDKIFNSVRGRAFWKVDETLQLASATDTLNLPDGTIDVLDIYVEGPDASTSGNSLRRRDFSYLREAYPVKSTTYISGQPTNYALEVAELNSGEPRLRIRVAPRPDATYDIVVSYYGKAVADSLTQQGDSGTTWLSVAYPDVLMWGAIVEAYMYTKGEPDLVQAAQNQFNEALMLLKNLGESREATDSFSQMGKQESKL